MESSGLSTLRVFSDRSAAEVAASKLNAYGIETFISADDAGGMIPPLSSRSGVKLQVPEEQVEEANRILE